MSGLFAQLRRRNVFRVAAAYVIVAWLALQVATVLLGIFHAPSWVAQAIAIVLIIGFPIACVFAWAFELTPEGVRRTAEVDEGESITAQTGRRLDVFILVALVALIGVTVWLKSGQDAPPRPPMPTADAEPLAVIDATDPAASIAVLPFVNMSADPEQAYFSDGITEELLNVLARIDALKVASRTSAFAYRDRVLSIPEIAGELGVNYVLEGSVRKAGEQVRITAQLIDAKSDRHLWSDTYDRSLQDIFAIQSEIANAIGDALAGPLGLHVAPIEVRAVTEDLDAYQWYLRGRELFRLRGSAQEMTGAIHALEQAVALDPEFLQAQQLLGATYHLAKYWNVTERSLAEYEELAALHIGKALELDPDNAFTYAVRGYSAAADMQDYAVNALADLDRALALDPDQVDALHWRGITFVEAGLMERGEEDQRHCLRVDPGYRNCRNYLAGALAVQGRIDEANAEFLIYLQTGNFFETPFDIPWFLNAGSPQMALALGRKIPGFSEAPLWDWILAMQHPEGDHALGWKKWQAWSQTSGLQIPTPVAASFGAWDQVELIDQSLDWVWLPMYSKLRSSPPFRELATAYGWPTVWRHYGFPPQCRPVGEDDFACE